MPSQLAANHRAVHTRLFRYTTVLETSSKQQAKEQHARGSRTSRNQFLMQTRRDRPAKRLRSASVTSERDKRQLTWISQRPLQKEKTNTVRQSQQGIAIPQAIKSQPGGLKQLE